MYEPVAVSQPVQRRVVKRGMERHPTYTLPENVLWRCDKCEEKQSPVHAQVTIEKAPSAMRYAMWEGWRVVLPPLRASS